MKTASQFAPDIPCTVPVRPGCWSNRGHQTRSFLLLAIVSLFSAAPAAVVNWTNTSGGLWSAATNWDGGTVPAINATVFITNTGVYTVTQDMHVTLTSLTLGGISGHQTLTNGSGNLTLNAASTVLPNGLLGFGSGTLTGTGALTVDGEMAWAGGTISGTVRVSAAGRLVIIGSEPRWLNGAGTLINHGTVVWSGSNDIHTANLALIINQPGALFDIQNNQLLAIYNGGYITNFGTLRKSAGGGLTIFTVPLFNSGTLDVQSGGIGYGANSQFYDGTAFIGAGTNVVYGGTATFNGPIASVNLEINGANIGGNGSFSGGVNWASGNLPDNSTLTIATNGTLNITGVTTKHLAGSGTLINHGVITWSGSNDIQTANSARIINQPGALFDIQNNQLLAIYNGGYFTNLGTLRKSAGAGTTIITVPMHNSGILDVQSGLVGYGTSSQFNDGTAFTGAGTNLIYAGTATFNGGISSVNLELAGPTLAGTGSFSGVVNWTSGNLSSGALTIASNGVLNITGTATKHLNLTGTLINHGVITWTGSNDIQTANSAGIVNQPGAVFDIQNNQLLEIYNGGYFTNLGTLRKTAGGSTTIITVPVSNSGVLDVQSGLVAYGPNCQFSDGSAFTGPGTNLVYAGTVTFAGAISSENLALGGAKIGGHGSFSGVVSWTAGDLPDNSTLTIATNGVLNICGTENKNLGGTGTLINFGTIIWSGSNDLQTFNSARIINQPGALFDIQNDQSLLIWNGGAFTNRGTLRKSAGAASTHINLPFHNLGTLDAQAGTIIFADYTQTGGTLSFGLNSLTNFGRLAFARGIAFTGTLQAVLNNGFAPVAGDTFEIINYTTHSGTFNEFALPATHAWQTNSSIYSATAVTLAVLNSRPDSPAIANQTTDEQVLLALPVPGSDSDAGQSLTYALLAAPEGANLQPNSGWFTWMPTEAQGPTTNVVAVEITDNGSPPLRVTNLFVVIVNEVNLAPSIIVPASQVMDELTTLAVTNAAIDPDLPANTFHYHLGAAPDGVTLDPLTGWLSWTPTELQGPSTNLITVVVTDNGTPSQSATNSFTVLVREVNVAPVLTAPSNCTHVAGALRWLTNSATDPDVPAQQFTFSLRNAPPGMSIGPTSGLLVWGPPANCAPLTNLVTVCVADNGSPVLTNEQSFMATLISHPRLKIARSATNAVVLSWPAAATDAGFALQSCSNFPSPASWQPVGAPASATAGECFLTNDCSGGFRAYRLASSLIELPALQIARTATNTIVVSWPTSATAVGFVPQITSNLATPTAWSDFVGGMGTNGSWNFVTEPASVTARSYRLRLVGPP